MFLTLVRFDVLFAFALVAMGLSDPKSSVRKAGEKPVE